MYSESYLQCAQVVCAELVSWKQPWKFRYADIYKEACIEITHSVEARKLSWIGLNSCLGAVSASQREFYMILTITPRIKCHDHLI